MKILLSLILLMPFSYCLAADFNYLDPGDYFYINRWGDNEKVVVVRKLDYPDVKVRDVNTGESKVVPASKLLTKSELGAEELGNGLIGGLAALAVIGCIADTENCKKNMNSSQSRAQSLSSSGSSSSSSSYNIIVNNECDDDVKVAIHYKNANGNWLTKYWWNIKPESSTYLSSNDTRLKTKSEVLYYYADNDRLVWKGDSTFKTINGESYGMRKLIDKTGDTEIVLTCS